MDQDAWALGGARGLEPDLGGVGSDPNYLGGSWVDQRGTRREEPIEGGEAARSDESIQTEAHERLTRFGRLDAHEIVVDVSRREITLSGCVPDEDQKRAAGDIVEAVPGVGGVHNLLQVRAGPALSVAAATFDRDDD
ncbi:MAG: BON domain-containing protein [Myxococcales bacterium]|nr:BON domain-containing protein [Myxococcales bacterium]